MSDQELRDAHGKYIGKIRETGGKFEGRDANGKFKGTYNPKLNETRDANGKYFGKGNLLAMLITSK